MKSSVPTAEAPPGCQTFPATVVPGHQVASGNNGDPRFPGGTIRMQMPHFKKLGLDLSAFFPGTINVSIAPGCYEVIAPRCTLKRVKWHPTEPEEDFSFFDVEMITGGGQRVTGWIYHPHPETKPEHFQQADVLELLLPHVEGLSYGIRLELITQLTQIRITTEEMESGH